MKDFLQYAAFLREYDALLKDVLADHRRMLSAVTSGRLEDINHSMNTLQAGTMRMEQMEAQRQAMQAKAGYADLGIRQVAQHLPADESAELLALCDSIDATIQEIRFVGEKSKGMAQCNLAELDPALLEGAFAHHEEGTRENPYEKLRRTAAEKPAMETKA